MAQLSDQPNWRIVALTLRQTEPGRCTALAMVTTRNWERTTDVHVRFTV
jgi:hypothetical protein